MKLFLNVFLLIVSWNFFMMADITDNFDALEKEGRLLQRGEWHLKDGVAHVESSEEIYKKYNNHGPIIKWSEAFVDGVLEVDFKPTDVNRVVFTYNGDGHIFRITFAKLPEPGAKKVFVTTRMIAWAEKSSKQNKGTTIKPVNMPELSDLNKKWNHLKFSCIKGKGVLEMGDFVYEFEHEALKRKKTQIMVSIGLGTLSVKNMTFKEVD